MDGADFPDESGAKFFQHLIDPGQDPPELMNCLAIIRSMNLIVFKTDGIRELAGHGPDFDGDAKFGQSSHELLVKAGDGLRREGDGDTAAVAGLNDEFVIDEV